MKQSLDGSLPKMCPAVRPTDQDGCTAELSLTQDPMGNSHKKHLVWNQLLNQNQTLMEQSLDGPFLKLCPAVALSDQDGHHSAVALLLKAALIQVSDYRLLGASGYYVVFCFQLYYKNKGNRQVTRPQVLQETFEQCADVVVQKLQSYFTQADEYHNQCLQGRYCLSLALESSSDSSP